MTLTCFDHWNLNSVPASRGKGFHFAVLNSWAWLSHLVSAGVDEEAKVLMMMRLFWGVLLRSKALIVVYQPCNSTTTCQTDK